MHTSSVRRLDRQLRLGYGVGLGLLLLVDAVAFLSVTDMMRTVRLQVHAHRVLDDLAELLAYLKDAETGQRGFLLTGDERYLGPYLASVAGVREDFRELRELTADNPGHRRGLDLLEPLVDRKLEELQNTIELYRGRGLEAALTVVFTDEGKRTMDEIRAAIAAMKASEKALLTEREQAAG